MVVFLYFLVSLIFIIGAAYLLYIPLPNDISDRPKLQIMEIILRIILEYGGDVVEYLFGSVARNSLIRNFMWLGFKATPAKYDSVTVKDDCISGVRVRVYQPHNKSNKRCVVFIHGGGWCTMQPEYYDDIICGFARRMKSTFFSIDYRLAPEHPYPAAVEDCEAVVTALKQDLFEKYDIDPNNICLMGDSAGGNLSAVLSQRASKRDKNFIRCQVLVYPVTHVFGFLSSSFQEYNEKFRGTSMLSPRSMARWLLLYVGLKTDPETITKVTKNQHLSKKLSTSNLFNKVLNNGHESECSMDYPPDPKLSEKFLDLGTNPDLSPLFGVHEDLPPTMVITCGYDILRDEGMLYAKRLSTFGVKSDWKHYPTAFHGILNMPKSVVGNQMKRDILRFVEEHSQ